MLRDPNIKFAMRDWVSRSFKRDGVPETPELHRILDLPRRVWEQREDLEEFTADLSRFLRKPGGTQTLWPHQAVALEEMHDYGGLLGPIPVGEGKTLISYLAPVVMDAERPLLVIPANLVRKTHTEFAILSQHWREKPMQIQSYEKLSREGGTEFLKKYSPDLWVFDETHRVKNRDAAVTRKISQWMKAHPDTVSIFMGGTIIKRSLLDFSHLLRWALPNGCPLPQSDSELEAWAAAVDEIRNYEKRVSTSPGALVALCSAKEKQEGLAGIRSAVRRRIQETPGVVAVQTRSVGASLNISLTLVDEYGGKVRELAKRLNEGVLPNGDVFLVEGKENSLQALQARWRVMRTITSGFWYDDDPPPPKLWQERRVSWKKIVKRILEEHLPGLESEALIVKAALGDKLGEGAKDTYLEWRKVKDQYARTTKPVWEDDSVVDRVAKWCKKHSGLIWVSEVALGERLEEVLGLSYFHEMGEDRIGRDVESMRPSGGSIVLSVASNSVGRNLQHWDDNLVISPPPTGNVWEQLLGRTHRSGQQSDEVSFEVLFGCLVEWRCWQQALRDAELSTRLEGPKKLLYSTLVQAFKIPPRDGALWDY